jgi:hypothetical protein
VEDFLPVESGDPSEELLLLSEAGTLDRWIDLNA